MNFYLGIDGGGTKTKFVLGDETTVLAEATTAGSNILRTGEPAVREALTAGVRGVCAAAKIEPSQISRTVAGIAGSSNQKVRETLTSLLSSLMGGDILIVGDMVIAHHAALKGGAGVLVNAGTGSIAYGKNAAGETARAGGWGFAISDEGSGHWIGRVAIAGAMRRYDAKRDDGFLQHLMAAVGAHSAEELAQFANSTANPDLAQVVPAVISMAKLKDSTAVEILRRAGTELACLAETVLERLFEEVPDAKIAASGGIFQNASTVYESFCGDLQKHHPGLRIELSEVEAAMGALEMARHPQS